MLKSEGETAVAEGLPTVEATAYSRKENTGSEDGTPGSFAIGEIMLAGGDALPSGAEGYSRRYDDLGK